MQKSRIKETKFCKRDLAYQTTLRPSPNLPTRLLYSVQCVAVCCSMLQCVAVCCSVLQYVAVRCSPIYFFEPTFADTAPLRLQGNASVCCSELQCVAVCCSVLQCGVVCCSVEQCVAVCCSVLQCVTVHYIWSSRNSCAVLHGSCASCVVV